MSNCPGRYNLNVLLDLGFNSVVANAKLVGIFLVCVRIKLPRQYRKILCQMKGDTVTSV